MPGLLGSLYSQGNVAKRKLADLLGNPIESLQQIIGHGVDRAKAFDELSQKATDEYLATKSFKGPYQNQLSDLMAEAYNPVGMTVWHGSPHKFSKFDSSKIGTGEGAQAKGYGLYSAELRDVAEGYRKDLSTTLAVDGRPIFEKGKLVGTTGDSTVDDLLLVHYGDLKAASKYKLGELRELRQRFASQPKATAPSMVGVEDRIIKDSQQELAKIRALRNRVTSDTNGYLYKIDLPDEQIAKMLDWDKPLSQQHPDVQKSILKYWQDNPSLKWYGDPSKMTGEGIYGSIKAAVLGSEGGGKINLNPANQAASMDLRHYGIPGIRYLDGGSRGAGQGTSNFVVFPGNEELLKILERNGGLLD